jgi:uncharacterized protein
MTDWADYQEQARSRGALAKELFVVRSVPAAPLGSIGQRLSEHLAYQGELESRGALVLAGPLSDEAGNERSGESLIVYRAASMDEARALADGDPMHASGLKTYELRAWLLNEGALQLSISLSNQRVTFG